MSRVSISISGESGQGINTIGDLVARALKEAGLYVFGYREYPSLIKGGVARYQLDISDKPLASPQHTTNILLSLSRVSVHEYLPLLAKDGVIIHAIEELYWSQNEQDFITANNLRVQYINAFKLAAQVGGNKLMANMVLLGLLWQSLQLPLETLKNAVTKAFGHKPALLEMNHKCVEVGFTLSDAKQLQQPLSFAHNAAQADSILISGNEALALGAIAAGVRAYYAYPMTPASSILTYLSKTYKETGILIKQAEDEITAVQMALGGMVMGTRTLTATSGGGFDLMTETLSLAGMIETPLVVVLGQRPGPATGLPSWTSAADLNLAVYSGHGEFPRVVLAASDATSAFVLIQKAFNLAEEFQVPVIVLTEKQIAESLFNISSLPKPEPIRRGLVPAELWPELRPEYRFGPTESGVSLRWLPGTSSATYDLNSDEHTPDGSVTEDGDTAQTQIAKRMRKMDAILAELPEPVLYGPSTADFTFIGWGSSKTTMLDLMSEYEESTSTTKPSINYLHFEYLYPLRTERFKSVVKSAQKVILYEANYQGQLGQLLTQHTGYQFKHKLLKYNGRPFMLTDIKRYLTKLRSKKK